MLPTTGTDVLVQVYALLKDGSMVPLGNLHTDVPLTTIEPELERRGYTREKRARWELKKKTYKTGQTLAWFECSWCGLATLIKTPYCPECGAKMEEEK